MGCGSSKPPAPDGSKPPKLNSMKKEGSARSGGSSKQGSLKLGDINHPKSARQEVATTPMKGEVSHKHHDGQHTPSKKREIVPQPSNENLGAKMIITLSDDELQQVADAVFALWDLKKTGTIDLLYFLDVLLEIRDDLALDMSPSIETVDREQMREYLASSWKENVDQSEETVKLLATLRCHQAGSHHTFATVDEAVDKLYSIADEDGNGDIDKSEFKLAMKRAGIGFAAVLFNHDDADGNGVLDRDEFSVAIRTVVDENQDPICAMSQLVEAFKPMPGDAPPHTSALKMAFAMAESLCPTKKPGDGDAVDAAAPAAATADAHAMNGEGGAACEGDAYAPQEGDAEEEIPAPVEEDMGMGY